MPIHGTPPTPIRTLCRTPQLDPHGTADTPQQTPTRQRQDKREVPRPRHSLGEAFGQ